MHRSNGASWWRHPTILIAFAALGVAVLYVSFVHIDHVLAALPLLFILACPLMHLFMHRHGHKHEQAHEGRHEADVARNGDERP